jgi:hypothetical protein
VDRATVAEKARRFLEHGMLGLIDRRRTTRGGRRSYQDLHEWLVAWPALAFACGRPPDAQGLPTMPPGRIRWRSAVREPVGRACPPRAPPVPAERARPHHR